MFEYAAKNDPGTTKVSVLLNWPVQ